jgi:hypothetical protein
MNKYIVQTTVDLKNPEPDRRFKDWTKRPTVEAGSRFIVSPDLARDGYGTIRASDERYAYVTDRSALGKLIIANSTRVEPVTVRELSEVHDCPFGGSEILRILLKLGKVGPEDFKAVAAIAAEDENF